MNSLISGQLQGARHAFRGMHVTNHEISSAPQKLRALLKPSAAAAQKMPGALTPSSNSNAATEQTVSQAFAVRACGASG